VQENAITIQSEIERAFSVFYRRQFHLTGSSRTDAGVHALQNFFHLDAEEALESRALYNINSILPEDIAIKSMRIVTAKKDGKIPHARFDAIGREYKYFIQQKKDPFTRETAFYYPYALDIITLNQAATLIKENIDFTSFCKKNTQVKTFNCVIEKSDWAMQDGCLVYRVKANRFLRGMVRSLVGTMLHVGRNKISMEKFNAIINARDCSGADFAAPAHGLFLIGVEYPENFFG